VSYGLGFDALTHAVSSGLGFYVVSRKVRVDPIYIIISGLGTQVAVSFGLRSSTIVILLGKRCSLFPHVSKNSSLGIPGHCIWCMGCSTAAVDARCLFLYFIAVSCGLSSIVRIRCLQRRTLGNCKI